MYDESKVSSEFPTNNSLKLSKMTRVIILGPSVGKVTRGAVVSDTC